MAPEKKSQLQIIFSTLGVGTLIWICTVIFNTGGIVKESKTNSVELQEIKIDVTKSKETSSRTENKVDLLQNSFDLHVKSEDQKHEDDIAMKKLMIDQNAVLINALDQLKK